MRRRTFIRSAALAATALALPRRQSLGAVFTSESRPAQDLEAVTGDGRQVMLSAKSIADLRARMRGTILLRGNAEYDGARRVLNPSFDKYPALIAQPTGTADVRTAIDYAREHGGLLLAVKCGGHSASGQSTCDRGMQIDLSRFRGVRVDPFARRAWVAGGSLLGQVDHEAQAYELVTPMGTVSHTGVGGLVTGGGFGRVARRFGLSVDNLMAVDVVSADGELRRASATENPDLFWGVRGGGGNFGVVTSFEFRLHPMQRRVVAGRIIYPAARAREVLTRFAQYGREAPDELDFGVALVHPPGGQPPVVMFQLCYSGPPAGAERAIAPLRGFGAPMADTVTTMDYVAVQRSGDIDDPRALGTYLKSGFIRAMPADLVSSIVERIEGHPGRATAIFFQMGGGAIARVPTSATAFAQRDIFANMLCAVDWKHGDDPSTHIQWIKQYWSGLERFTDGFYVNDVDRDLMSTAVADNFRQNHQRLVAVKNKYDPTNLFRLNANVRPTVRT